MNEADWQSQTLYFLQGVESYGMRPDTGNTLRDALPLDAMMKAEAKIVSITPAGMGAYVLVEWRPTQKN
jgi:hypothetical protein